MAQKNPLIYTCLLTYLAISLHVDRALDLEHNDATGALVFIIIIGEACLQFFKLNPVTVGCIIVVSSVPK